jgi:predicted TIM-barrel fold metal-dependent hydrolase
MSNAGWDCHVHVFDAKAPARVGHYVPVDRPLLDIEATASRHGVAHLVLVQPSVYGSDNSLMLEALRASGGRHRGVIVVDAVPDAAKFDAMHALGVRGVRFNWVSPVGDGTSRGNDIASRFDALAPHLRRRGWHVQWYARAEQLDTIAKLHAKHPGVIAVLDHVAGLRTGIDTTHTAWHALDRLAVQGAWVKLSGWYRLDAPAPYDTLLGTVRRVHERFAQRLVWGSDWPHTAFAADAMPAYASTWQPVVDALGADAAHSLRQRMPSIYQ